MQSTSVRDLKALVTGAGGFLGTHLCQRLLDGGAIVDATSRSERQSANPRLRWRCGELANYEWLQGLLRETRPDVIFHLAGHVSAAPDLDFVLPTFHSLLTSTVNLLTASAALGKPRIILTGSLTEPMPMSAEPIPTSPYAAAKWMASTYAQMFHRMYGVSTVILRPFMTYGPAQHPSKLIPHVILSLLAGRSPRLANGDWQADWIYVDDVIDAFMIAATRTGLDGANIDLGTGALHSTRDIVQRLVARIDPSVQPSFGAIPNRPGEQIRSADLQPARVLLDWQPRTSLDQGLEKTIQWYRDTAQLSQQEARV